LTDKQIKELRRIKREVGAPFTAVIRIALDKHLGFEEDRDDEDFEGI